MKAEVARPLLLIGLSILLLIAGQILLPGFLSPTQIGGQLKIAAFLGLFGLCQTLVIAAGGQGLDLSVEAAATLGGILGAALMQGSSSLTLPAAIAAAAAGLVVRLANGVGIAVLGVPPLVTTLAIGSVVDGALIVVVSAFSPSNAASPALVALAGQSTSVVPNILFVWVIITALALWLFGRSGWGRQLLGTGANPLAAWLSGARTTLLRVSAYGGSGLLAAISGFLLTGYVGQAFLGLGNSYVLVSVVVAALGGVALGGGRAPYVGVLAAAIMITVLVSLLTAISIGESGRQLVFGVTLLIFLLADRHFFRH
jgi:ribose transport system permease protein